MDTYIEYLIDDENSFLTRWIKPQRENSRLIWSSFLYGFLWALCSKSFFFYIVSTLIVEMIILLIEDKFSGELDLEFRYVLNIVSISGWFIGRALLYMVGVTSHTIV